jgi:hypothetical protein
MLLRALDADAERIVEDVDAGNAQDVASALTSGTQTDGGQRGRDDDAMQRRCAEWEGRWPQQRVAPTMREIRGGIRNGDAVQGVLGEERLHRVWERQTEALADARAHAWDPKDYTPATDPLGLVERGVDMPAAHEYGGFWRVGACDAYGWDDATDARINADPVQRLWQRCSAMEIDGRGLKDKNGTWVTSDAGGRKKLEKHGQRASWRVRWLTVCLHLKHHFTHAAATDASLVERDGRRRLSVGIYSGAQPNRGGGRAWDTEQHVGAGMMGAAVPSNWEVCDAELYAILLYLRTVVLEREWEAGPVGERRVLVLSDCAAALQLMEMAWRRGVAATGREGSCGPLLEEICAHRRRLGMW